MARSLSQIAQTSTLTSFQDSDLVYVVRNLTPYATTYGSLRDKIAADSVSYSSAQTKTDAEKTLAKANIGLNINVGTSLRLNNWTAVAIQFARRKIATGTYAGQACWVPTPYSECYLRDFAMLVEAHSQAFSAPDIDTALAWFHAKRSSNAFPSYINPATDTAFGHAYLDGVFCFTSLVYSHYKLTGNTSAYSTYASAITTALGLLTVTGNLVMIADVDLPTESAPGWGFQEIAQTTGGDLILSVLRSKALRQLQEMASAAGDAATAATYGTARTAAQAAIDTALWDGSAGWFRSATIKNFGVHNVIGSVMAAYEGECSEARANTIAQTLIDSLPGGSLAVAGKGVWLNGAIRHFPADEDWAVMRPSFSTALGDYQRGGYWPAFTGWAATVMARVNRAAALDVLSDLTAHMLTIGTSEWFKASGGTNINHPISSAMPLMFYSSPYSLAFPAAIYDQVIIGTPSWSKATSVATGLTLDNGTDRPPPVRWYDADNRNWGAEVFGNIWQITRSLGESGGFVALTLTERSNLTVSSTLSSSGSNWCGALGGGGATAKVRIGEVNGQAWVVGHNSTFTGWAALYINSDAPTGNDVTIGKAGGAKVVLPGGVRATLPTSSAGLSAGDMWNDAGTVKIV